MKHVERNPAYHTQTSNVLHEHFDGLEQNHCLKKKEWGLKSDIHRNDAHPTSQLPPLVTGA